ncbi:MULTISPECIES: hypothetical protein [Photorhabdus]|uniref:Uncharacterized protein n=1 Tax=Photorhabdus kayaii TaxID=230088 RepID=A0ABX0AXR4_9GAMM|nr:MULTISPECIES: hypothetical protein [Photorhabdus]MCC8373368.1 hypothetical protein [Photorhabdus bodei]MCT8352713.1 hypothetical protein [Photorhabdus kayaii]MDB6366200.1 hypothetical protein [Photorhabdus bodei]NDL10808.1 hypothetical protein [Photorhabdus kayaii]NDL24274.1 hypothetical protein [Photorhabdus kayaii]
MIKISAQNIAFNRYTQWISRWIATARERIPGSIANYVTGVSECSQQRGNLKDDGYKYFGLVALFGVHK